MELQGLKEKLLARGLYWLYASLANTYKIYEFALEEELAAKKYHPQNSLVLACWHEHLLAVSMAQKGKAFSPLASRSASGRVVAAIFKNWGFKPVFGSSRRDQRDKGGKEALKTLISLAEEGYSAAFTVDGSIGPRRKVKPGVISLAQKTGMAILPVAAWGKRVWQLATWDKLKIPKPWTQVVVAYEKPLLLPSSLNAEDFLFWQEKVAEAINKAEKKAMEACLSLEKNAKLKVKTKINCVK